MRIVCGILAIFLIGGAIEGSRLNLEHIAHSERAPKEPAQRQAYIAAMFVAPVSVAAVGVWCGYWAVRPRREARNRD